MKLKADAVKLYYKEKGTGSPIVFVHGWMEDYSMWNSQIDYFSKSHRVIAYDQRGHGRSDKPKKDYSVKTLSDDLYNFTQKLDVGKFYACWTFHGRHDCNDVYT
jgi:non-heme chloroperoxidase